MNEKLRKTRKRKQRLKNLSLTNVGEIIILIKKIRIRDIFGSISISHGSRHEVRTKNTNVLSYFLAGSETVDVDLSNTIPSNQFLLS